MHMEDKIKELKEIVHASSKVVFFGGAGVSTESGIPDFRSVDGLYNQKYKYPPEQIISHSYYRSHPEEFFEFYKDKMIFTDAKPNAAHIRLAELEREGHVQAVITQNIDGLHQMAGSRKCWSCTDRSTGTIVKSVTGSMIWTMWFMQTEFRDVSAAGS